MSTQFMTLMWSLHIVKINISFHDKLLSLNVMHSSIFFSRSRISTRECSNYSVFCYHNLITNYVFTIARFRKTLKWKYGNIHRANLFYNSTILWVKSLTITAFLQLLFVLSTDSPLNVINPLITKTSIYRHMKIKNP